MKMYTKPEIEISVFATEDIITTSAGGGLDNSTTGGTTTGLSLGGTDGTLGENDSIVYTELS